MAALNKHLKTWFSLLVILFQYGCTDQRTPQGDPNLNQAKFNTTSSLKQVASVQFQNANTQTLAIVQSGGSLYLTGRPFGFARWDISVDPESPTLTFAASDQIDTFAPTGRWVVDYYASGALGLFSSYAFLSGTAGMSVINISSTNSPVEVLRKPPLDPNSNLIPQNADFVYRAIVAHPTLPVIYGFSQQDFMYTLQIAGGDVQIATKAGYGAQGANVCCVKSATVFGGRIFVAFGSQLVWFSLQSDGSIGSSGAYNNLQASNVASTGRYLYVQNTPTYGQPQGLQNPRGFYVFNLQGQQVDYIASDDEALQFTVDSADSHIYMNVDDTALLIHRIQWANAPPQ